MALQTIVGPLTSEHDARDTAKALGSNCSVYSMAIKDDEGYDTDGRLWYVERDDSMPSGKLFGYDTEAFMRRQYRTA